MLRKLKNFFKNKIVIALLFIFVAIILLALPISSNRIEFVPMNNPSFSGVETSGNILLEYSNDEEFSFVLIGNETTLKEIKYVIKNETLYISRTTWVPEYEKQGFEEFFRLFSLSMYSKTTAGFPYLSLRLSNNAKKNVVAKISKNTLRYIAVKNGGTLKIENYNKPKKSLNIVFNNSNKANIKASVAVLKTSFVNSSSFSFNGNTKELSFFSRGGGEANFNGIASVANVDLGKNFNFRANSFELENLNVLVGNTSKSWVNVSSRINATVRENGFLAYDGGAEIVINKVASSGEIIKK